LVAIGGLTAPFGVAIDSDNVTHVVESGSDRVSSFIPVAIRL
jgi:hypothetical protein